LRALVFQHQTRRLSSSFPGRQKQLFEAGAGNVFWGGGAQSIFALIAMPKQPAPQIVAHAVNLPALDD